MTRDPDLVYRILLAIEAKKTTAPAPIELPGADKQKVLNHLASLYEEGLFSGQRPHRSGSTREFDRVDVGDLTPPGRRLLASLKKVRSLEPHRPQAVEFAAGGENNAPPRSPDVNLTGVQAAASAGEVRAATNNGPAPSAQPSPTTIIVTAVSTNKVALQLTAFSLLRALDAKIDALHRERSNSEDVTPYENLRQLVEEFLAAAASASEAPVVEKTLSLAGGLKSWWNKDHASICNKVLNIGLFASGLSICALAGALPVSTASIVTVGALVGGKDVAESLGALAKALTSKE
ncbi:hypothetical protein [Bradyrhizobium sp. JYMT SZCCT0180]|uniref:hypothetical protein n=1 Tax=Bradyrhizobium sp. JYMT SZCCT0180 TaxID=2807666 RepID=UPI001BAE228D|nr:hypothetical protein [Bradyrhizobium sp. JYMT SZCCT0180]MBR1216305.1 hypothetical protein [Bradyrhizobium sp. JYMT SZCCT0180]